MIRRAIGRLILWFTNPVTAKLWQPWPRTEEANFELAKLRTRRLRAMLEHDEKVFKHVR